jgi:hypothetical protein
VLGLVPPPAEFRNPRDRAPRDPTGPRALYLNNNWFELACRL